MINDFIPIYNTDKIIFINYITSWRSLPKSTLNKQLRTMRYLIIINTLIISLLSNTMYPAQREADEILANVSKKLNSPETLKYTLQRELNYPSQNYHKTQEWEGFYDFKSTNNPLKFTYQVDYKNDALTFVYNGTEEFILDRNKKQIQLSEKNAYSDLEINSFFFNYL